MCRIYLTVMRSFVSAAKQYSVQWEYNQSLHDRATTRMPACTLRLLNITSGGVSVDGSEANLNSRDGFFHMARLREGLNALDRCGWKRSYHQRTFHEDYLR